MGHFRFTIASLLGVVCFVAVAVAALRRADGLWDGTLFTLTLGLLLISVLLAVHRTERRWAYWLGFTLFGWTYLGASLIPPVEARLLTTRALAYFDSKVLRWDDTVLYEFRCSVRSSPVSSVAFSPDGRWLATDTDRTIRLWDAATGKLLGGPIGTSENFVRIGHSLTALVLAFLGGHLSWTLYAGGRGRREETSPTAPPSTSPTDGA